MSTDLPHDRSLPDLLSPVKGRSRSRALPRWAWMLLLVYLCAVSVILSLDALDNAIGNILTLVCTFLTCSALFIWFCFFSGYPTAARKTVAIATPAAIVVLLALFRIDGVDGVLIPQLRFRWQSKPDELLTSPILPQPRTTAVSIDSASDDSKDAQGSIEKSSGPMPEIRADVTTTTPQDFPQFLGPHRSNWLPEPTLDPDWSQNPPKLVWQNSIGAGWSAFSVVNGFAVTLEQRGEDELVVCYEASTGKPVWVHTEKTRHDTTLGGVGPRSTPTIVDGKIYALGATGILNCLEGATGNVLWQHRLLEEYGLTPDEDIKNVAWGRSASPLVIDGLVVVPAGGPAAGPKVSLVAFDKDSGSKVWEGGDDQIAYASPAVGLLAGVRQVLSVNETTVTGHDPETGKVFWSFAWPGMSNQAANTSQAIALAGDRVFVSKGYTGGSKFLKVECDDKAAWSATKIWEDSKMMKTKFTNVVLYEDHIYGLSDGTLECIELATGKRCWKHGRYGHGQILGVRDLLIVVAETGEVALVTLTPKEHQELGRFAALEGKTWNNPALYGRYLLVRNSEQAACYELPLAGAAH